ncbi:MAG: hypothetical protein AAGN66_28310 [Acidobacteriota bacterium]
MAVRAKRWRRVPMDIHNDPGFRALSLVARYVLLHLHTQPLISSLGCMRQTPEGLAAEMGVTGHRHAMRNAIGDAMRETIDRGYVIVTDDAPFVALPRDQHLGSNLDTILKCFISSTLPRSPPPVAKPSEMPYRTPSRTPSRTPCRTPSGMPCWIIRDQRPET